MGHLLSLDAISTICPDWLQEVVHSYEQDAASITLLQELAVQSPNARGFTLDQDIIKYKTRMVIGVNLALQTKLITALHDNIVGGRSGIQATHQQMRKLFYWPGLKLVVEFFVKQCLTCQQAKHEHIKPAGQLQPLPPPTGAWHDLTMDFIEGLPNSEGYNVIVVVIDRLTKYAHFIHLHHHFTAASVAKTFLDTVVRLHGVSLTILSDRDRIFMSNFWGALLIVVGSKLNYTTHTSHKQMGRASV